MKLRKNRTKRPFQFKGTVIRNYNNQYNNHKKVENKQSREDRLIKLEENFQQKRQEYINLFKACPEALVYTNIEGIILEVNRYFEELSGYREDELKGNSIVYCLKPEEKTYFETESEKYFETTITRQNNSQLEVAVNKTFNQINQRLAGMIYSFREISLLRRERKMIQSLYRISQLASSHIPLQELYPLVHEQLGMMIDATNFYIAIFDSEQEKLNFPYYTDEAAGEDEIFIHRYCSSQSIFRYILKIGKPVLMDFQRYRKMLSYGYIEPWDVMTNTHLWLAVPLKANQKTIGVIALQSYDNARLYSEKDIDLLEFIAGQLSIAIYTRLLEEKLESIHQNQENSDDRHKVLEQNSRGTNRNKEVRSVRFLSSEEIKE